MMQSGMFNSIKNSNFLENKENFDLTSSIREVPSLIIPFLYENPPVDNLKEVISKLNENLTEENKKFKFKKLKKNNSGSSDVSWRNDSSSSEESEISTDNDDDELVKSICAKKHDSFSFDDGTNNDFFEKSIGSLLMSIGSNLANEQCAISMYREKKKSSEMETSKDSVLGMKSIIENIRKSKVENIPFKFKIKCCEFCKFKTESDIVMASHYETPHTTHQGFKCNFCRFISCSEYKIKFHMETVHNIKACIQKNGTIFQCEFCEFDSPLQFVAEEHIVECKKRFNLKRNLVPPADWEPPAKKLKEFSSVIKKEVVTKVEVVMPSNPIKVAEIPLQPLPRPLQILPPLPPLTKNEVGKVVVQKVVLKSPTIPEKNIFLSPCCEICETPTANFDHFRRHMQYLHYCILHKIKLQCKRCFLSFYTDRGFHIHMLGLHGIVTNGMREDARKGKDGGRCPICKQEFTSKLLEHVHKIHMMSNNN